MLSSNDNDDNNKTTIMTIRRTKYVGRRNFFLFFMLILTPSLVLVMVMVKDVSATTRQYPVEETVTLEPETYYSAAFAYPEPGIYVRISVEELDRFLYHEVEEPPVDVLFLSPEEFQQYESAFNQSVDDRSNGSAAGNDNGTVGYYQGSHKLAFLSITEVEFFLKELDGIKYKPGLDIGPIYMVIENANFTYNGAPSQGPVRVKIIVGEEKLPRSVVNDFVFGLPLNVVNVIFSLNTIFPIFTGVFGIFVGYRIIPLISSRKKRTNLDESQKKI